MTPDSSAPPRHVIDFIVAVLDPKKDETVLDPACGTAGFLISAWKHVLNANTDGEGGSTLTPDDRERLARNFTGYDISPDMVRLSLVNMYLHGFTSPDIREYDTLTSEENWDQYANVILANPPFMSPKGGIRPHKRFSIQSTRSEVLFVDYMAEHLMADGRAGIIVPESVIFQTQRAHTALRKMLVESSLAAVVSLPGGVFQPYSGVKTSVLVLDKTIARRTDKVAFFKVEHDGYDLGAQRRPTDANDLPQVQAELAEYLRRARAGEDLDGYEAKSGFLVEKSKLAENADYNLSAERYRLTESISARFPMTPLDDVAEIIRGITFRKSDQLERQTDDSLFVATTKAAQESGIVENALYHIPRSLLKDENKRTGDILISTANSLHLLGRTTPVREVNRLISLGAFMSLIRPSDRIMSTYLLHCLRSASALDFFYKNANTTTNISNLNLSILATFQIPLSPLDVQREIVAEIEGYQRVIDGARAVVESYRPHVPVDPLWPVVRLGDVCFVERGASPRPIHAFTTNSTDGVNWIKIGDAEVGSKYISSTKERITLKGAAKSRRVRPGDFLLSNSMSWGRPYIVNIDGYIHDGWLLLRSNAERVSKDFLYSILISAIVSGQFERAARSLVDANRELIERMESRIASAVGRVWGEG